MMCESFPVHCQYGPCNVKTQVIIQRIRGPAVKNPIQISTGHVDHRYHGVVVYCLRQELHGALCGYAKLASFTRGRKPSLVWPGGVVVKMARWSHAYVPTVPTPRLVYVVERIVEYVARARSNLEALRRYGSRGASPRNACGRRSNGPHQRGAQHQHCEHQPSQESHRHPQCAHDPSPNLSDFQWRQSPASKSVGFESWDGVQRPPFMEERGINTRGRWILWGCSWDVPDHQRG
eukprot:scaffold1401_cov330-Pavlova_lutheri.AAC.97